MRTSCSRGFRRRLLAVAVVFAALPALAQNKTLDEQTFREFEQIVADFSTAERIQAWEAFLQKYPASSYVPQVKQIISELRGEKRPVPKATPSASTGSGGDPDLAFLDEDRPSPTPKATPRPVVVTNTPRPRPTPDIFATPTPAASNPFMDSGTGRSRGGDGGFSWDGGAQATPTPARIASSDGVFPDRRGSGISRPPRRTAGVGKATHTEVGFAVGFSPDETYVRNVLFGMTAAQRFGRTWGLAVEALGASNSETRLLQSLRNLGAEPEVISKYNFIAGATAEANVLSAIDRVTGQIPNRNDLYVRAGGGIVNTDLEICKETAGQPCASPLFIEGVNFGYLTGGVGHRFYVTRWATFRSEVRGRVVFELIDGEMTPRSNIQVNLGPTFVF